jgi:hypothetical protein
MIKDIHKIYSEKLEGREHFGYLRWKYNDVDRIHLAHDRDLSQALVNTVAFRKTEISWIAERILASLEGIRSLNMVTYLDFWAMRIVHNPTRD